MPYRWSYRLTTAFAITVVSLVTLGSVAVVVDAARARPPAQAPARGQPPGALGCEPIPEDRLTLLQGRSGFGQHVTGGAGGCLYRVTTLEDDGRPGSLRDALDPDVTEPRWIVFDVDGLIWLQDGLRVGPNRTIDGRWADITIGNGSVVIEGGGNVIVANVRLRTAWDGDLLRISHGASPFWLDHVTFDDASDEYVDISAPLTSPVEGTISWCRFEPGEQTSTQDMAVLIGDGQAPENNHNIRVTLHHNYFDGTRQRHPLVTGALVHSFNNVIRFRLYGMQTREWGQIVSENDIFDGTSVETERNRDDSTVIEGPAFLTQTGAYFRNGARPGVTTPNGIFWPAWYYSYDLEAAGDDLAARVEGWAGRQDTWP